MTILYQCRLLTNQIFFFQWRKPKIVAIKNALANDMEHDLVIFLVFLKCVCLGIKKVILQKMKTYKSKKASNIEFEAFFIQNYFSIYAETTSFLRLNDFLVSTN